MASTILIADCGATKSEWCLISGVKQKTITTQGISPYFLTIEQIRELLTKELIPGLKGVEINELYYYGTGCADPENVKLIKKALSKIFPVARLEVTHDVMAAARALCASNKGLVCNLGTGSFACFYNGKKITRTSHGAGYVLGDEGSGTYLGKKVIQYYLYNTYDEDLMSRFNLTYHTNRSEILENVYRKPFPNRYLATFTKFLTDNRGHYMVENIIEDGLNDFFFTHLCKFGEVWTHPVNFVGSVALGFKDVLQQLCDSYEFELGKVIKKPMTGLIEYHS